MGTLYAKVSGVWEPVSANGGGGAAPGDIDATVAAVPPAGWLLFGQTVVGADLLHPDLWAVAPTAWKVGTDLVLPDLTDCYLAGRPTPGAVGGSNTVTLTAANLPAHAHTMAHTHSITHDHASFNATGGYTGSDMSHQHDVSQDNAAGGVGGVLARGVTTAWSTTGLMSVAGAHTHTVTIPVNIANYAGNSLASSAANTGNSTGGTALALDTTPKHLRVNWIIKT